MARGYAADDDALIRRLHRIEGQVRGIERMVSAIADALAAGDSGTAERKSEDLLAAAQRFSRTR